MNAKLDMKDEDVYTTFDKNLRRALERQVQREVQQVKIVDLSKYGDKHFKLHKMKSNAKLHESSRKGVESFLPTINDSTRAFIYNTVNKEDKRNGLIIIPSCLTLEQQVFWSYHVLKDLLAPHLCKTNMAEELFDDNLFGTFVQDLAKKKNAYMAPEKVLALKYASFGYHVDWGRKKYHPNRSDDDADDDTDFYTPYPSTLGMLASHVAACVLQTGIGDTKTFYPETTHVHFLTSNDRLQGYYRNMEPDQASPIINISLLNDAIVLIGGDTKEIKPIPVHLHSGDIMIMTGTSRHCVQGVTKVLKGTIPQGLLKGLRDRALSLLPEGSADGGKKSECMCDEDKEEVKSSLERYFNDLRIDMDHRQVFSRRNEMTHQFFFLKNHEMTYY